MLSKWSATGCGVVPLTPPDDASSYTGACGEVYVLVTMCFMLSNVAERERERERELNQPSIEVYKLITQDL